MVARIIVKDLRIHDETGVEALKELRSLIVGRKFDVLEYIKRNFEVEELVLVNPFGKFIIPSRALVMIEKLSDLNVSIVDDTRIVEGLELPDNFKILNDIESSEFSSNPVNNVPKIEIDGSVEEIPIPALWIEVLDPDCPTPVSKVKERIDSMRKGDVLIVVLNTYILKDEYEAIDTLVKETGGFIVDNHDFLIEPRNEIETEFMRRMKSRSGKFLGMKILRGEGV